jgi:quercetin dioxygenase-like cupin family protein
MYKNYRVERWTGAKAPQPAKLKSHMEREGYRVYQWSATPGTAYALHRHDEDQSHWIISGVLELTIENEGTFVLQPGDRDFMPAGTYHSARVVGETPVVYLIGERI